MTPPEDPPGQPPVPPPPPTARLVPGGDRAPLLAEPGPRRNPLVLLLIGLVVGALLGLAAGYALFNGKKVAITDQSQPSPSPSASASASASATATPTSTPTATSAPTAAPQGVLTCPPDTPAGWHQLDPLDGPAPPAGLDFCGRGSATVPTGTSRFLTSDHWGFAMSHSCAPGTSGQSGMGMVLTVEELIPGGGLGPDKDEEVGDWSHGQTSMAHGGNFQLRITAVAPDCVWHIGISPKT